MATTFVSKSGRTFGHTSPHPDLGIRLGVNVAQACAEEDLSPKGSVLRLARDLALYGADSTRDAAGNILPAPLTGAVKDPSRIRATLLLSHLRAAARWYASHDKVPSHADMRTMIETARDEGGASLDEVRGILADVRSRTTSATLVEMADKARGRRRETDRARRLAKKQGA